MADWVKCTRRGSDEIIFINLDQAYKIEQQKPEDGTVIQFSHDHAVVVKEPADAIEIAEARSSLICACPFCDDDDVPPGISTQIEAVRAQRKRMWRARGYAEGVRAVLARRAAPKPFAV